MSNGAECGHFPAIQRLQEIGLRIAACLRPVARKHDVAQGLIEPHESPFVDNPNELLDRQATGSHVSVGRQIFFPVRQDEAPGASVPDWLGRQWEAAANRDS